MNVVHFLRKQGQGYSVERLFTDVRDALPPEIVVEVYKSHFESKGIWRRIYNMIEAALHQSDVNHITGDVHFLTYLMSRRRMMLTVLDCVTLERLKGIKRWVFWFFWYWLPVKRSLIITVISHSTKKELLKYVKCSPDKIKVIHCPVSGIFTSNFKEFNETRPRILQIGTNQNKNIERLGQALSDINCQLVVIGSLSDTQRFALDSNDINYKNLCGLSDAELLEQYQMADILAFVSTYEGFGLPIVEANAVGRPVITSNLYSMPEVAGDAACLVDPYDVEEIRSGFVRIISNINYRNRLVKAGFRNVERFRPDFIATQYADVYRKIYRDSQPQKGLD